MAEKPYYYKQPRYPSAFQMGKNLVLMGKDVAVNYARTGKLSVPQHKADYRLNICKSCPHFDTPRQRCRLCGCAMGVKVWLHAAQCPANPPKW